VGISREVYEMLGSAFARVIWVHARIREGVELSIGPYQLPDRSPRIGLRQPESNFADNLVTLIAPSPSIAAKRDDSHGSNQKTAHAILPGGLEYSIILWLCVKGFTITAWRVNISFAHLIFLSHAARHDLQCRAIRHLSWLSQAGRSGPSMFECCREQSLAQFASARTLQG
jgi:hypothetical protein